MNFFYVYQNRTYSEERKGGFLWSPKFAKDGRTNAGYETMKQVRPGDVILHSCQREIVAISVAKGHCYSAPRPSSAFSEWGYDGWKIDVEYLPIIGRLDVTTFINHL